MGIMSTPLTPSPSSALNGFRSSGPRFYVCQIGARTRELVIS